MKKASNETDGDVAPSGGKRKRMILVVGVVLVAAVAGKFVLGGGGGAAAAAGEPTTTTTAAPGPVEVLEPVTLMLADGRYLKLGIALQLHGEHVGGGEEGEDADPRTKWAKGLDLVISALGRRTFTELVDPDGRDAAKRELTEQLRVAYPLLVEEIYFTEFVLQ